MWRLRPLCATAYTYSEGSIALPFLIVELKLEAAGGNLYQAGNQAAGIGTYSLRPSDWLLDQVKATQAKRQTNTITFTMAGTGRLVVLPILCYSLGDGIQYMYHVKGPQTPEPGGDTGMQ